MAELFLWHKITGPGNSSEQSSTSSSEPCNTVISWHGHHATDTSRLNSLQGSYLLTIPATPATIKKIDKRRLNELESSTLVELIKDYMKENQELRRENMDLFAVRDMMLRDQELVCRENERLLKKLEDVNS